MRSRSSACAACATLAPGGRRSSGARRILPTPEFFGVRVLDDFPLAVLREYIDWSPFFHTWGLRGIYPRILDDEAQGEQARQIFHDGNVLLDRIVQENLLTARGVHGFFSASAVGDDVELYADHTRTRTLGRLHFLRQQANREGRRAVPLAGRLHRTAGDGAVRLNGCLCSDDRHRTEGAVRRLSGRARRLQRHHGRGAGGPAGGGVCRVPAQARPRPVGLWLRGNVYAAGPDQREVSRHSAGAWLSRPARTTRRREQSGACWTWKRTPACCSPNRSPCGRAPA